MTNELTARIEAATADDQRELLKLAFCAIHGDKPARVHGGSQELTDWLNLHSPFWQTLQANAYESAALTLVPEGMQLRDLFILGSGQYFAKAGPLSDGMSAAGEASTPALAICAAALRAKEAL